MSSIRTLLAEPAAQDAAMRLAAGLPLSIKAIGARNGVEADADIFVISGVGNWAERSLVAQQAGATSILVLNPKATNSERICALAQLVDQGRAQVALAEQFAGNPSVIPFAAALAGGISHLNLHSRTSGRITDAVFEQLRVIRALKVSAQRSSDVAAAAGGSVIVLEGLLADSKVVCRSLVTRTSVMIDRMQLGTYHPETIAKLSLFGASAYLAAHGQIIDSEGALTLPSTYEQADRATLRAMIAGRFVDGRDLLDFAKDVDLLTSLRLS